MRQTLGAAADKMRTDRGLASLGLCAVPTYGRLWRSRHACKLPLAWAQSIPDYEDFKEEFLSNYEQAMTVRSVIFEGVHDLLAQSDRAKGMRWGVVTNKHRSASPCP